MNKLPANDLYTAREHIINLDRTFKEHLTKLYNNNPAIIDMYVAPEDRLELSPFSNYGIYITPKYIEQIERLIERKLLDFDHYLVIFRQFLDMFYAVIEKNEKLPETPYLKELTNNKYRYFINNKIYIDFERKSIGDIKEFPSGMPGEKLPNYYINLCSINITTRSKYIWLSTAKFISKKSIFFSFITGLIYLFFNLIEHEHINKVILGVYICYKNIFANSVLISHKSLLQFVNDLIYKYIWIIYLAIIFLVCYFIWIYIITPLKNYLYAYIKIKNIEKYDFYNQYPNMKLPIMDVREYPLQNPSSDLFGTNLLVAFFYYNFIYNKFIPEINQVIVIDGIRGMGKTSFINFLVNKINGKSYRGFNKCYLLKQHFLRKAVRIVQLQFVPFIGILDDKEISFEQENEIITKLLNFVADNLSDKQEKFIHTMLGVIDKVEYKGVGLTLKDIHKNHQSGFKALYDRLLRNEKKTLIIIEDIDRLKGNQLKLAIKILWFLHELPFTITLIPGDEDTIKRYTNFKDTSENITNYEEQEFYKLFQPSFPYHEYIYKALGWRILNHMTENEKQNLNLYDSFSQIHMTARRLKLENKLSNEKILESIDNCGKLIFENLGYHVQDSKLHYNNGIDKLFSSNYDYISRNAVINDIVEIFKKYKISMREFKWILRNWTVNRNNYLSYYFIIQKIFFMILTYRYPDDENIKNYIEYLKNNIIQIDRFSLQNKHKNYNERLDSISGLAKILINDTLNYPCLNYTINLKSFFSQLFMMPGLGASVESGVQFLQCAIKEFNFGIYSPTEDNRFIPLEIYKKYSVNLLSSEENTYLNKNVFNAEINANRVIFILLFNILMARNFEEQFSKNPSYKYNIYFLQNLAINFIALYKHNINNVSLDFDKELKEVFNGNRSMFVIFDNYLNQEIIIYRDELFKYFQIIFNIRINKIHLELDNEYEVLKNSIYKLKKFFNNEMDVIINMIFDAKKLISLEPEKLSSMILKLIKLNPKITIKNLAEEIGVEILIIEKQIMKLKQDGILFHVGRSNNGYWQIIENDSKI